MEVTLIWAIAQRELREALRNKWLWFYALAFAGLALALSWILRVFNPSPRVLSH